MRKILTIFTAFAVALMLALFVSASPPVRAAEKPEVKQSVKLLIVGAPDAGYVAAIVSQFKVANVSIEVGGGSDKEPAVEPSVLPTTNPAVFEAMRHKPPERRLIGYRSKNPQTNFIANYQSPFERFFGGFDKPARAKI